VHTGCQCGVHVWVVFDVYAHGHTDATRTKRLLSVRRRGLLVCRSATGCAAILRRVHRRCECQLQRGDRTVQHLYADRHPDANDLQHADDYPDTHTDEYPAAARAERLLSVRRAQLLWLCGATTDRGPVWPAHVRTLCGCRQRQLQRRH
jgi:hypothetical protein